MATDWNTILVDLLAIKDLMEKEQSRRITKQSSGTAAVTGTTAVAAITAPSADSFYLTDVVIGDEAGAAEIVSIVEDVGGDDTVLAIFNCASVGNVIAQLDPPLKCTAAKSVGALLASSGTIRVTLCGYEAT